MREGFSVWEGADCSRSGRLNRLRRIRKPDGKYRVFRVACGQDYAVVSRYDFLRYGQTQPGTAGFAGARRIQPIEFFENRFS